MTFVQSLPGHKPPNPSRTQIKPQVDHVLNSVRIRAGNPAFPEPIDDHLALSDDLLFGLETKEALAISYTTITLQYQGGRPVSLADAGGCDTVGDAVNLVHNRACGK